MPRESLLAVSLEHAAPALVNEIYSIEVKVANAEEKKITNIKCVSINSNCNKFTETQSMNVLLYQMFIISNGLQFDIFCLIMLINIIFMLMPNILEI